jgi:hypothetical protein
MMKRLGAILQDKIDALSIQARPVLGIYADPACIVRLRAERDAAAPHLKFTDFEFFAGYPIRNSQKPGVWIIVDVGEGRSEAVEVA